MLVSKDAELTVNIIEKAIDENEELRNGFTHLENYYLGRHDILSRTKPDTAKNNLLITNHAKYITDINTGYLMGNPIDYNFGETPEKDTEVIWRQYNVQHINDLDNEIAKDCSIFGKQYELVYATEDNDCRSADVDVRNAFIIKDDTVAEGEKWGVIYSYGEGEKLDMVTVYDEKYKYDCLSGGKVAIPDTSDKERVKAHMFGYIPIIEYKNNSEETGDFESVISLIDAYNLLQSDRVNDKEQLVEAILVGYGVTLEDEQRADLIANRMAFGLPPKSEAELEYLVKNLDESELDILRRGILDDIHKISQTPNMSDENFVGNSSGVAIRYKLIAFEQSIKNKERYFERGLLKRMRIYNNYLSEVNKMSKMEVDEIKPIFKRNLPQNDLEIAQMIEKLKGIVDDETLAEQLSFVEAASETVKKARDEMFGIYEQEASEFGTVEETTERVRDRVEDEVETQKKTVLDRLTDLLR
jgi:SPP1 family phage portal protein